MAGGYFLLLTNTDNGKPFMDQDGSLSDITAGPIWTTMALLFRAGNEASSVLGGLFKAVGS
jgi:hypothetical protein